MISVQEWRKYVLNAAICIPSIFLVFYLFGYIASNLSAIDIFLIFIPFIVKLLISGRLKYHVYQLSIVIFLLFLLGSVYSLSTGINLPVISWIKIPLTFTTLTSGLFAIGIIIILEAILSDKLTYTVAEYVGSMLIFMQQLAVIAVMLSPELSNIISQAGVSLNSSFGISNPSAYESAYFATISLEAYSFYSLLIYGYQQYLPLAIASTPVDGVMIVLFIVSAIAIIVSLYIRDNHKSVSRLGLLGSYSVIGALLAAVVLLITQRLEYTSYQILVIAGSTAILLLVVGYTSSRVPGNETINTSVK